LPVAGSLGTSTCVQIIKILPVICFLRFLSGRKFRFPG
jgi:hypothetical protein